MAVVREESLFDSTYADKKLHLVLWKDGEKAPKGIVQISHGMCEYVLRYDELANALVEAGYVVCGNDHLGHGETASNKDELGFMADKDGYLYMVKDLRNVSNWIKEQYPGLPLVLYGHSMGSFLARLYASTYSDGVAAYVFSGTGGPNPASGVALKLIDLISKFKGEHHRSPFLTKMAFGSYTSKIPEAKTGYEWVTKDPVKFDEYLHDPFCMYLFTLSGYRDLMSVLGAVSEKGWASKLNKDLPYLLVSGDEDPVGDYGKGVQTVYERMKEAGCTKAECRLIPGMRHEPHNEVNRKEFYKDTIAWLDAAIH
ncbi:MAG: alpha/beta fold hydrolase [Oscillospiraceae bacterium]|nr:alpha/beta fold hydrolase [Oscillospiraceae bacterium]